MKDYIPGSMAVIIGTTNVTNWESLSVDYDEDFWTFYSGSGGELTRTKNSSRLGMITVEIPQTSPANAELSAAAASDGVINTTIMDVGGLSIHQISEGTVMRIAPASYAKTDQSSRTWILKGNLDINIVGGN